MQWAERKANNVIKQLCALETMPAALQKRAHPRSEPAAAAAALRTFHLRKSSSGESGRGRTGECMLFSLPQLPGMPKAPSPGADTSLARRASMASSLSSKDTRSDVRGRRSAGAPIAVCRAVTLLPAGASWLLAIRLDSGA